VHANAVVNLGRAARICNSIVALMQAAAGAREVAG
jgi:hypothetical protein